MSSNMLADIVHMLDNMLSDMVVVWHSGSALVSINKLTYVGPS